MPFIAGYKGNIFISNAAGAMTVTANRWSVEWVSDSMDVTSLINNSYEGFLSGVKDLTVSFDAFFDTKHNPFDEPIHLAPGNYYTVQINYDDLLGNPRWSLSPILCTEVRSEASVRDTIRYTFTGKFSEYRDDSLGYNGILQTFNNTNLPVA